MAGLDTASAHSAYGHPPFADASERFLNRELSWLEFNARVLALAEDAGLPLLERTKFLAIFSQNLDEFFQVRVAGLKDQVAAGFGRESDDGLTPAEQLQAIRARVNELGEATGQRREDLGDVDQLSQRLDRLDHAERRLEMRRQRRDRRSTTAGGGHRPGVRYRTGYPSRRDLPDPGALGPPDPMGPGPGRGLAPVVMW